ncbi:MAG: metallophosphoesterase [Clostridia bacterium]|nr:metallophosphoesterase [Clostridia bacterium]
MEIRFGLFADLHYALPESENRGYSQRTFDDMKKGLARFAEKEVSFAVCLGDIAQPAADRDEQYRQIQTVVRTWSHYGFPVHPVMGNHEFQQLTLEDMLEILQTDRTYYSFSLGDIRFVILDSAYNPDDSHFSANNFDWRYGKLSDAEVHWLKALLADGKRTFLFTHGNFYLDPDEYCSEWYHVLNHREICDILEESGCVEAVFQGHHHTFRHALHRGIRFVNIPSPERSPAYCEADFPVVEILDEGFLYNGERLI